MTDQPATPSGRLSPGDTAPDFTLPTDTGEEVSLSGLRGRKVIVYFYPAAMTPGCTKQACDFTDSLDSLKGAGYEVIGISPDKPAKLAKFRERDHLTITLASDEDRSVMTSYGAFGEKKLYGKTVQGVIRSTIVVDEDGKVALAQYNVKATGHVAKLRRDLSLDLSSPTGRSVVRSIADRALDASVRRPAMLTALSASREPVSVDDVHRARRRTLDCGCAPVAQSAEAPGLGPGHVRVRVSPGVPSGAERAPRPTGRSRAATGRGGRSRSLASAVISAEVSSPSWSSGTNSTS